MAKAKSAPTRQTSQPPRQAWNARILNGLRRLAILIFLATAVPVLVLRWVPPPASLFMLIDRFEALLDGDWHYRQHYRWTPWNSISRQAKLAVVASEDQTFVRHLGFDFKAMGKALEKNRSGATVRGGSTITQQTAKNLFLYPGRSYLRKLLEAYFTTLIELSWPKQRILEIYLNIAEFGSGIYGVGAASQIFFGKPAARLGSEEAAALAAVLPSPKHRSPSHPAPAELARRQWILEQMRYLSGTHALDDL